jgi:hypothetical protein
MFSKRELMMSGVAATGLSAMGVPLEKIFKVGGAERQAVHDFIVKTLANEFPLRTPHFDVLVADLYYGMFPDERPADYDGNSAYLRKTLDKWKAEAADFKARVWPNGYEYEPQYEAWNGISKGSPDAPPVNVAPLSSMLRNQSA